MAAPTKARTCRYTRFVFDMQSLCMGFVYWDGGEPVDRVVVRVADMLPIPRRRDLGDLDKTQWPEGPDGRIKDPWSPDARARMVAVDKPHGEFTITSSSWGGKYAIEKLCRDYLAGLGEHPGEMPVIELGAYKRVDKKYGKIDTPTLEVVGWALIDDVLGGKLDQKKQVKAAKPSKKLSKKQTLEEQIAALEAQLEAEEDPDEDEHLMELEVE